MQEQRQGTGGESCNRSFAKLTEKRRCKRRNEFHDG
jgi:hypothetical protein